MCLLLQLTPHLQGLLAMTCPTHIQSKAEKFFQKFFELEKKQLSIQVSFF